MGFIKRLLKNISDNGDEKAAETGPEELLERIFNGIAGDSHKSDDAPPGCRIKKTTSSEFLDNLEGIEEGWVYYFMDNRGKTGGALITGISEDDRSQDSEDPSSGIPPSLPGLLFLEKLEVTDEYFLNFHFILPVRFRKNEKKKVIRLAEGAQPLALEGGREIYLLVDYDIWERIEKNYPENPEFSNAVEYFLFGENNFAEEEGESLILDISRPEEFLAGRFFLPKQISGRPEPVFSRFEKICATKNGDFFGDKTGLWFRVQLEIKGTSFPVYYYFDRMNRDDAMNRKNVFRRMFRIIVGKNVRNMARCGIKVDSVKGDFDNPPSSLHICESVLMGFNLFSLRTEIHGWVVVSVDLIKLILYSILPPWAFRFLSDNLLNRLRMLFSLSSELQTSGKMSLYERPERERSPENDPCSRLRDLKLNFIKLNELLELITPKEARLIVANFLYRHGWTGEKLKELFYFRMESGYDEENEPVYTLRTLIGFDEPRFRSFLMKNMADQWINSEHAGIDYERGMLEHFEVLRLLRDEIRKQKYFTPSDSLHNVLEGEFEWYRDKIAEILEGVLRDKNYLNFEDKYIPDLNLLLTNMPRENLVTLFRYAREDLPRFKKVISENLYNEVVSLLEETSPELDEKATETVIHYRKRIHRIIHNMEQRSE